MKSFHNYKKQFRWLAWVTLVLYLIIVAGVLTYDWYTFTKSLSHPLVLTFVLLVSLTIVLFAYPQILGTMCNIVGAVKKDKIYDPYNSWIRTTIINNSKRVAILYTTKDDFIEEAFKTAFNQTYKNCDVIIMDDSTNPNYINKINEFKANSGLNFNVVRRGNWGPRNKSGSLNYFLENYSQNYDYFAVMDSDTYLDKNFVEYSLKYFQQFDDVAIVQATVRAIKNNKNMFQDMITPNYTDDYRNFANKTTLVTLYGTTQYDGHSCMMNLDIYRKLNFRYKSLILDDFSTNIDLLRSGYRVFFAPNILCYDEASPNYFAWKKTNLKWEKGTFECMGKYFFKFPGMKCYWYERWYLWYWGMLNITTPLSFYLLLIFGFISLFDVKEIINMPIIAWVLSMIYVGMQFGAVPVISKIQRKTFWATARINILEALFYFSIMPSQFLSLFVLPFKKKAFDVSIKENKTVRWYDCIVKNIADIIFYLLLFAFVIFTCVWTKHWLFAINPIMWLMFASFISIFFMPLLSNKPFIQPKGEQ